MVLGQMAEEMFLAGQRVLPVRALAEGFTFTERSLGESLAQTLK
jgi:NAD dependent epimerase/dehydratase family enzyme